MARNAFIAWWTGDNSDPSDADLRSKRPGETNEEYLARVVAARDKAINNMEDFKQARKLGLIDNGMTYDQYLIESGKATEIKVNDDGSATVNGRYMSPSDYEHWYHNVRR